MNIHWVYIVLTVVTLSIHTSPASAEIIDSSVAVVNQDVITRSDVNRIGEAVFRQINEEVPAEQREQALQQARNRIITQLIENKLLSQQATARNISVTKAELDHARNQVIQRNNFTDQDFRNELQKMGLSQEQYRETLREQILRSKLINYEVRSKVVVPDKEIEKYFVEKYSKQIDNEGYYILQVGISWADITQASERSAAKKNARNQIEAAHSLAQKGEDFKELARQYSNLSSAADGGDLGFFTKDEMAAYMRDAVTALQPGEISPVIERPDSYTFFKLLEHTQDNNSNTGTLDEDTRKEIRNILYKQEAEKRYKTWLEKIRNEAYIKIL
jgi:peptidyl-prolyl cis-trans isomerase SurA